MRSRLMWKMLGVSAGLHALALPWAAGWVEIGAPGPPRASRVRVTLEASPAVRRAKVAPEGARPPGPAVRKGRETPRTARRIRPPRVVRVNPPAAARDRPRVSPPPSAARSAPGPIRPKGVRPPASAAARKPVPRRVEAPRRVAPPAPPVRLPKVPLKAASSPERPARTAPAPPPERRRAAKASAPPGRLRIEPPLPPGARGRGVARLGSSGGRNRPGADGSGKFRFRLRALRRTAPAYPAEARRRGVEGTVWLRLEILSDGRVGKVEVVRSSGSVVLDQAAARSAASWRFAFDGDPPPRGTWAKVPVRFRIVRR